MTTPIKLVFRGYWREPNKAGVPAARGVFCVYSCEFDADKKVVSLKKLIFIGSSDNAKETVATRSHEWSRFVGPTEQLCYSFASVQNGGMEPVVDGLQKMLKQRPEILPNPSWTPHPAIEIEGLKGFFR